MSQEAKRVKIFTLVAIALGLVCVIAAIVLAVQGVSAAIAGLLGAEGAATIYYGGKGALIANVPARLGQLVKLSIIILVVQVACIAGIVLTVGTDNVADNSVPLALSAVSCLDTLIILLLSRGITKRAER